MEFFVMSGFKEISKVKINTMRFLVEAFLRVSRVKVIVNGIERVPLKSSIFVSNHFTRLETMILPYVIYTRLGITPRSLTANYVFDAFPKDFMESVGSVPLNFPDRDELVAGSLIKGESWIIFPEGRMVKDREVMDGKRFAIHDGDMNVVRPPHTGAAALGLKAQMAVKMMNEFVSKHRLTRVFGFEKLPELEIFFIPVNITYYPLRVVQTTISRQVERFIRYMEKGKYSDRFEEELKVESSLFSPGVEVAINFGQPKRISEYSAWLDAETVYPTEGGKHAKMFRRVITAIMNDYMAEIYKLTTINPDHLIARLLSTMVKRQKTEESWEDIRKRIYITALKLRDMPHVFLHPIIEQAPESLMVTGDNPLDSFISMCEVEGLATTNDGKLVIDEKNFKWPQKFDSIRILNTAQVITNELGPLLEVNKLVDSTLKINRKKLDETVVSSLIKGEEEHFSKDYARFYVKGESKAMNLGAPRYSLGRKDIGVLLVHGYMASPEEMRPLMEYLVKHDLTVYSTRLRGHGTSPYDLLTRSWEDWFYSVRVGYTILSNIVDNIFICGFSAGGALSWHLVAQRLPKLRGIISISAAMKLVNRASVIAPYIDLLDRAMKYFGIKRTGVQFVGNDPENPHINYFKNPVHGVDQLLDLIGVVQEELKKVKIPAFIIQGGKDPTVDPESARDYFDEISSKMKRLMIVDSPYHGIVYRGGDDIFSEILNFVLDPEKATAKKGST